MTPGDIKPGLMRAACEMVGGTAVLAQRLGISEAMLRRYISGSFPVPDTLILRALDVMQEQREARGVHAAAPPRDTDPAADA